MPPSAAYRAVVDGKRGAALTPRANRGHEIVDPLCTSVCQTAGAVRVASRSVSTARTSIGPSDDTTDRTWARRANESHSMDTTTVSPPKDRISSTRPRRDAKK